MLNNGKLRWKRHVNYGDSELDISLPAESVDGNHVEQKIELVIDRRVQHADVQINDDVYEQIFPWYYWLCLNSYCRRYLSENSRHSGVAKCIGLLSDSISRDTP